MEQELSLDEKKKIRFEATIDILYLINLTFLYVYSLLSPVVGIILAIILKSGSLSERGKKIGNTCLILALIGLGLAVLIIIIVIIIAVVAASSFGGF
jgi:hypothetical protein